MPQSQNNFSNFRFKDNSFPARARIFAFISAVIAATLFIVWAVSAANTTIGSNITTSGNLTVGGTSSLASLTLSSGLNASSTFQVSGISTFYNSIGIGSTSPSQLLSVQGNAYISGNISNVANINATGTIGVGTTSPTESISTSGRIYVGGTGTSTIENNLHVIGQIKVGTASTYINDTELSATGNFTIKTQSDSNHLVLQSLGRVGISSSTPWGVLSVERNGSNANMPILVVSEQGTSSPYFIVKDTGKVGIGTSSPSSLFSVQGNALLSGNLSLANLTATGTLTLAGDTFLANASTTGMLTVGNGFISQASSTVAGNFQVSGGLNASSTLTVASGARFYSTLQADSLSSFVGGFISSASSTIAGNFHTSGVLNASSTLLVANLSTLAGGFISQASSTINGPLQIAGNLQASSTISANNLFVAGNVGIGTTSPGALLAVQGTGLFIGTLTAPNMIATGTLTVSGVTGTSTITSNLDVLGNLQIGSICINCGSGGGFTGGTTTVNNLIVTNFSTSTFAGGLTVQTNKFVVDNQTGNVGIGTTTPGSLLAVQGNGLFTGTLTAPNIIATGTLTIAGNTSLANASTTGMLTVGGGFISQASSTVSGNLQVSGGLNASSTLTVASGARFYSTLQADALSTLTGFISTASSTISGNFHASGVLNASSTLLVANLSTLAGGFISQASSTINGPLQIAGNLQASSTISANNLFVAGNVGIGTTSPGNLLSVQGTGLFTGTLTAPNIIATGTLTLSGDTRLANASTTGMLTIGNGFISQASSTISNSLQVAGLLQASSSLSVGGGTALGSTLSVTGTSTLAGLSAGFGTFSSNLVTSKDLSVSGLANLTGFISSASSTISSSLHIAGNLQASSTVSLATTTITVNHASGSPAIPLTLFNTQSATNTANRLAFQISGATSTLTTSAITSQLIQNYDPGKAILAFSVLNSGLLSEAARFDSNGFLGIGTTSPSQLLSVQGNALFSGNISSVANITATGTLTVERASTTGMLTIGGGFISTASSTVAGNLHVSGVLRSSSTLIVAGAALFTSNETDGRIIQLNPLTGTNGAIMHFRNTTGNFYIGSDDSTGGDVTGVGYANAIWSVSNTPTIFGTNNSERVRITEGGNVGIGTTTPGALLAVQGAGLFTGTLTAPNIIATGTLTLSGDTYLANASTTGMLTIGNGFISQASSTVNSSLLVSGVLNASSSMAVTGGGYFGGNVGIGTTSPWQHLGVSGGATEAIAVSGSSSGNLYLGNTGANARRWRLLSHTNVSSGGFAIQDDTQGLVRFVIDSSGNVGIGTTSPGNLLAIQGTGLFTGTLTAPNIIATGTLTIAGNTSLANASTTGMLTIGNGFISQASSTISNSLQVAGLLQASSSLSVGGGTALGSTLSVTGTSTLAGLSAGFGTFSSNLVTSGSLNVTGTSTIAGLSAGFGTFSSNLVTSKDLSVSGLASLSGFISNASSTVSGNLVVSGGLNASSTLTVAGASRFYSTLQADALSTLAGFISSASSTISGNFHASGVLNASSTLLVANLSTLAGGFISQASSTISNSLQVAGLLQASSSLSVGGGTALGSTLSVTGTSTLAGLSAGFGTFSSNLATSKDLSVSGLANLTGFISSASSTISSSLHIAGNLQASSTVSLATTTITVNHASGSPAIPLTLFNTQSATNTANRLAFQISGATSTLTTSAITSQLIQNYDPGKAILVFSVLNSGLLSEAARFDSNGFLGIGTTTPGALLAVHGNALIAGTTTVNSLISTSTALLATQGGNVGIGITSPAAKLHVSGNGNNLRLSSTNDTTANYIQMMTSASAAQGYVGVEGSSAGSTLTNSLANATFLSSGASGTALQLGSAGAIKMTILSGGNVGIGTTTPGALLAVQGNGLFTGTLTAPNIIATGTLTIAGNTSLANASTTGMLTIGNGFISSASSTVSSNFLVSGVLNASSSVAIAGVTSFYDRLSFGTNGYITGTAAGGFGFRVNNSANTLNLFEIYDSGGVGIGTTYAGGSSDPGVNNLIVQGNVGIGTTTPGARLSVHGDALIAGTTTVRALVATSSSLTVGGNKLVVDGSGNVGIGTTSPGYKLHVNMARSGALWDAPLFLQMSDQAATDNLLLPIGKSYTNGNMGYIGFHYEGDDNAANRLMFGLHSSDNLMVITNTGNVGIGTTTPGGVLAVENTGTGLGFVVSDVLNDTSPFVVDASGNVGIGTAAPSEVLHINSTDPTIKLSGTSGFGANRYVYMKEFSTVAAEPGLEFGLSVGGGDLAKMVIDNNGNVGIGTTTPGQTLSVHGNAFFSGDLINVANLTATGTLTQNAFAYTNLAASTEKNDMNLNLARTVQFASGNLATQRAVLVQAPTYSFTASSTLTDASTFLITGAPKSGTFATTTNTYALKIDAGSVLSTGGITPSNAYGLYVSAPTGATNNYGAVFASGNVGIGTAAPGHKLVVAGASTDFGVDVSSAYPVLRPAGSGAEDIELTAIGNGGNIYISAPGTHASASYIDFSTTAGGGTASKMRILNSGNIGIGTTTPGALLAVQGNALIAGTTTVRALVATSSSLSVGGSNFVVDGSGNVGIGTASPGGKLDVYDSAGNNYPFNVKTNKTTGVWLARFTNGNGDGVFFTHTGSDNTQITGSAANTVVIGADYSGGSYRDLALATNGAERMRITTGGNVGIGTTTPGALLAVQGTGLFTGTLTAPNIIATGTLNVTGLTTLSNASTTQLTTTNNTYLSTTGGKVVVGTTDSTLGDNMVLYSASANSGLLVRTGAGDNTYAAINLVGGGTNANWYMMTNRSNITGAVDNLGFYKAAGTEGAKMVLQDNGNVGIGTTSPWQHLGVSGGATEAIAVSGSSSGNLYLGNTGANARRWRLLSHTNVSSGGFAIQDDTQGLVRFVIDSSGNVGIGTSTPGALLAVQGNALIAGTTTVRALVATSSSLTVGGNKFVVDGSGNVGIGTAAPYSLLDITTTSVAGGALVRVGGLTDPGQATGILLGYSDSSIGTYNKVGIFYKRASTDTSQAQGELHFAVNNTADTSNATITDSKMMINKSGNVGIGTTSPVQQLSLASSGGSTTGINISNTVAGSYANLGFNYNNSQILETGSSFSSGGIGSNQLGIITNGSGGINLEAYNAAGIITFITGANAAANERMRITSGGNVGIGTTTPGTLLSVGGDAVGMNFGLATSTFSTTGGINLKSGCFAIGGTCITGGGGGTGTVGSATLIGQVPYYATAGTTLTATSTIFIGANSRVSIGTTTTNYDFAVAGKDSAFNSGASGVLGSWSTNPNALPAVRAIHSSITANGYVYAIGGYDGTPKSTVYYAKLNSDGSTGPWSTNANVLPDNLYGHSSIAANGYVYAIGGYNGAAQTTVYYAKLNSDGSTGAWSTNANALPLTRYYHSSIAANGYAYVMGGSANGSTGVTTVYYAKLNSDGSTGPWLTNANALPAARYYHSSITANGYAYVLGGTDGNPQSTVYYAKLNSDGSTGVWATNANALPANRYGLSQITANGYVYAMGGYDSIPRSTIFYTKLNRDGSTGAWATSSNALPASIYAQSSVVANGYVYAIGGNDGATNQTPVYYSSLPRVSISGNLDLLGLASTTLGDANDSDFGSVGSSIFAGNIFSAGRLEVTGNTQLWNGLNVNGSFSMHASSTPGNQVFTITSATSSSAVSTVFSVTSTGSTTAASLTLNNTFDAGSTTPQKNTLYKENIVKGWVVIDGGVAGVPIKDSFNVSSIADNGTGDYSVTWRTNFATANYAINVTCQRLQESVSALIGVVRNVDNTYSPTASIARIGCMNVDGSALDGFVFMSAVGDQ